MASISFMKQKNNESNEHGIKYLSFRNKKYSFNYNRIKEICLGSSTDGGQKEFEISQVYDVQDSGELTLSSKVEHETKISGNAQNDMIMYDILKMIMVVLLDDTQPSENYQETFSGILALNTLLSWGVIEEIK